MDYIKIAQDSIAIQSDALSDLRNSLDVNFTNAVSAILETNGRVVLCGVGKSGIVARKISSIFSSIGCPSFFIHANEASHGDLGAITKNDIVIILSNSGETKELVDVLSYCKVQGITVIAMVGRKESTLHNAADISLLLPKFSEISDYIKFPTTSATLMGVLGDSLALCVAKAKNVSLEQYRSFHPGGNIGNSLMKIKDIMRKGGELPIVKSNTTVIESLIVMSQKAIGCVLVADDQDSIIGMITDGDLRRNINKNFSEVLVEEIMTKKPKTISGNLLAMDALKEMSSKGIMHLIVTNGEQIDGVIHMHDCLRIGLKAQCE